MQPTLCTAQCDIDMTWDTAKPKYSPFVTCHDPHTDDYFYITSPEDCDNLVGRFMEN